MRVNKIIKLNGALLSFLVFAFQLGCSSMNKSVFTKEEQKKYQVDRLDVQGHRGARTVLPENSLPGFKYVLDLGVDTIELDMGVTKDNVVIVYHDQHINNVICQKKDGTKVPSGIPIRSLTLKEIKEFDCGSRVNPRFPRQTLIPGTEIPTLKEVFVLLKNSPNPHAKKIELNIETKSNPDDPSLQPEPAEYVRLVLELVKEYGLLDRTILQSFDHRTLAEAKLQAPEMRRAALFERRPRGDLVEATRQAHGNILSPNYRWLKKSDIDELRENGIPVIPWTANTPRSWRRLIEMGVDGIITDDPGPLMRMIGRIE